jgi:hypothetical protein
MKNFARCRTNPNFVGVKRTCKKTGKIRIWIRAVFGCAFFSFSHFIFCFPFVWSSAQFHSIDHDSHCSADRSNGWSFGQVVFECHPQAPSWQEYVLFDSRLTPHSWNCVWWWSKNCDRTVGACFLFRCGCSCRQLGWRVSRATDGAIFPDVVRFSVPNRRELLGVYVMESTSQNLSWSLTGFSLALVRAKREQEQAAQAATSKTA